MVRDLAVKPHSMLLPSDFIIHPWGSVLQNNESETIALNIMRILKRTGDTWRRLEWSEYKEERLKDGNFTEAEKYYFDLALPYCVSQDTAVLFSKSWNIPAIGTVGYEAIMEANLSRLKVEQSKADVQYFFDNFIDIEEHNISNALNDLLTYKRSKVPFDLNNHIVNFQKYVLPHLVEWSKTKDRHPVTLEKLDQE